MIPAYLFLKPTLGSQPPKTSELVKKSGVNKAENIFSELKEKLENLNQKKDSIRATSPVSEKDSTPPKPSEGSTSPKPAAKKPEASPKYTQSKGFQGKQEEAGKKDWKDRCKFVDGKSYNSRYEVTGGNFTVTDLSTVRNFQLDLSQD